MIIPSKKWFNIIFGGADDKKTCPKCGGISLKKTGFYEQKQRYKCKYCGAVFILKKDLSEDIYKDYVKNKLTLKLLSNKYK